MTYLGLGLAGPEPGLGCLSSNKMPMRAWSPHISSSTVCGNYKVKADCTQDVD